MEKNGYQGQEPDCYKLFTVFTVIHNWRNTLGSLREIGLSKPGFYFSSVTDAIFALLAFDVTTSARNFHSPFGSMTDW